MVYHYGCGMFMVAVTYAASVDLVDRFGPAHGDWPKQLISQRLLLAAGRQIPLTGGVYLASEMSTEDLSRLLATDPHVLNGVAAHSVVGFTPLLVAAGLEDLKDQ
ncbi:hypothetical protein Slala05_70980 [Streptomyces lavendulae subsp. lavendulae]|nr:hypothetical protein Slala05_70980 [Streptomyces lavendulae subsp. lavendulae]